MVVENFRKNYFSTVSSRGRTIINKRQKLILLKETLKKIKLKGIEHFSEFKIYRHKAVTFIPFFHFGPFYNSQYLNPFYWKTKKKYLKIVKATEIHHSKC